MLPAIPPPAGLGGDGDALGAEMPMGTGRAAAGGAESGGWKEMPAGCGPAAPPPCGKVPAWGWGTFRSPPLPSLGPACGVSCPPPGSVPRLGSDPTWGGVGCKPIPTPHTMFPPIASGQLGPVNAVGLGPAHRTMGGNRHLEGGKHTYGCSDAPPPHPPTEVSGGDMGLPCSAPGRVKQCFLFYFHILPPYF